MKAQHHSIPSSGDSQSVYQRELARMPVLTDEEMTVLGQRAVQGDLGAQEALIQANLVLVAKIARRYADFGLPLADVIAEGNLGLVRAAQLYDPKFGTRFTTYAAVWIKQRIHRALTKHARTVRIPVWRSQRLRKLTRCNDALSAELGRTATADELAERLGISTEQIAELEADRVYVTSLDAPLDTEDADGPSWGDSFADENAAHPAAELGREELLDEMMACLHELDDRELQILAHKHGFHPNGQLSFRELGRRLGLSHEWVRRIAELAVVKLRRALEAGSAAPADVREKLRDAVQRRLQRLAAISMEYSQKAA